MLCYYIDVFYFVIHEWILEHNIRIINFFVGTENDLADEFFSLDIAEVQLDLEGIRVVRQLLHFPCLQIYYN